jgi:hypothetical protein
LRLLFARVNQAQQPGSADGLEQIATLEIHDPQCSAGLSRDGLASP